MEKAKAAKKGMENFAFDGEVFSTGVDPEEYRKLEEVQLKKAKANMPSMEADAAQPPGGENVEQPNK